jgi:hypothetical protein
MNMVIMVMGSLPRMLRRRREIRLGLAASRRPKYARLKKNCQLLHIVRMSLSLVSCCFQDSLRTKM